MLDALTAGRRPDASAIALAAIKLVHEASGATADEPEIPTYAERPERADRERPRRARGRGERAVAHRARGDDATAFVHIGMGRNGGIRPADLVGAIANEAGLTGRDIGPIRITEHSSVVGVPASSVEAVIAAMSGAVVRGKAVERAPLQRGSAPRRRRRPPARRSTRWAGLPDGRPPGAARSATLGQGQRGNRPS